MWLEIAGPVNPASTMPGSLLTGLRVFHVIANLSFGVFLRRAGISAKRASPPNRASPAHVIGPLILFYINVCMYVCMYVCKSLFKHGKPSVKLKLKTKTNYNCFT